MPDDLCNKIAALEAEEPEAYDLLAFSAFLGPGSIPYEPYWFDLWHRRTRREFEKFWWDFPEALEEETHLGNLVDALIPRFVVHLGKSGHEWHLVSHSRSGHWYSLNGNLASIVKDRLTPDERHAMANRVVEGLFWGMGDGTYGYPYQDEWGRYDGLRELALRCSEWFEAEGILSQNAVYLLSYVSDQLASPHRVDEMVRVYQRALAMQEKLDAHKGPESIQQWGIGLLCGYYARFLEGFDRYADAEPLWRRATELYERRREGDIDCRHLALNLQHQGRHEQAIPFFERAIAYTERKGFNGSRYFAELCRAFADSLRAVGRVQEADAMDERGQLASQPRQKSE